MMKIVTPVILNTFVTEQNGRTLQECFTDVCSLETNLSLEVSIGSCNSSVQTSHWPNQWRDDMLNQTTFNIWGGDQ